MTTSGIGQTDNQQMLLTWLSQDSSKDLSIQPYPTIFSTVIDIPLLAQNVPLNHTFLGKKEVFVMKLKGERTIYIYTHTHTSK